MDLLSLFLVTHNHNWVFSEFYTDKIGYYAQKMFDKCEKRTKFYKYFIKRVQNNNKI